ncbi:MAG: hypothetical protein ACKOPE_07895 [Novosphingobium sp.]
MKRIVIGSLIGWSGIVGLGWWLADRRVHLCGNYDPACVIKATAARDAALTNGLTVALVMCVGFAVLTGFRAASPHRQRNGINPSPSIRAPLRLGPLADLWEAARPGRGLRWLRASALAILIFGLGWLSSSILTAGRGATPSPSYEDPGYAMATDAAKVASDVVAAPSADPTYAIAPNTPAEADGDSSAQDTADDAKSGE